MKTIDSLLCELERLQVQLWAEGDRLRYKALKDPLTPELLQQLKAQKTEILSILCRTQSNQSGPALASSPMEEQTPLSFAQQRLWFLDRLSPNQTNYNTSSAYRLKGKLNILTLERSLQEIAQRHEILRTRIEVHHDIPCLVLDPTFQFVLPVLATDASSVEERDEAVNHLIREETQSPFNLETDIPWRAKLLQLSNLEHILLITMHHIIADGWSMEVYKQELATLYSAFSQDDPSPLPALSIQYADYVRWQHHHLQGEELLPHLQYWKQHLEGPLPILNLPTDFVRPPIQTYNGDRQSFTLSQEVTVALKKLSQQQGVTLFILLLAAFQTLLYRYTSEEDIIIGIPIAGRTQVETEQLIGFFANTLALRIDASGDPSFQELLGRVRAVALGAYDHQEMPFEKLVAELQPERDLSRSPLFQVMFVLQNTPKSTMELPGLELEVFPLEDKTSKFDLVLSCRETSQGIEGQFIYNTDLFEAATIHRMVGHFTTLLDGITTNPSQKIGELPLLTKAESHQILGEWNQTAVDYPRNKCIHQLFEEQVERTPEAIAIVFENQQLTYRELNARANQLARHLQRQGVGPEAVVGIALDRSLEMIVSVIGVLKAGGAYLPMDPALPASRLSYMLKDADTRVLLSQMLWEDQFSEFKGHWVDIVADWSLIAQEDTKNLHNVATSQNLAYIIYTSGSTGYPKGVMVEHRSLCGFAAPARLHAYHVSPDSHVLMFGSLAFSTSLSEIFMTLLVGATLYIANQESLLSGPELTCLLRDYAITHIKITPSVLSMLPDGDFPALSVITVMGEPTSVEVLRRWLPNRTILSSYGATEVSVSSTCTECREDSTTLSIGRPVSNTKVYLLDAYLQPVPINVPGEIYIAGIGLARGYLNQPELTAQRFLLDPFAGEPSALMYKTGDLARYLPDGQIVHLGRKDDQVQLRGIRIELEEIKATLEQHPWIEDAVVIAREDQPGEKYLVAYIVTNQHQVPSPDDLRQFLKQKLPNYMIPSAFVPLEAIPLTLNGKVDRQALPTPDWQQQSSTSFVAPRTPIEEQLAEIWRTILWREQPIGIHDNFFDLGGHSLLAVRLVSEIEKTFNTKLPLATLFQLATIAELAEILSNRDHQTVEEHQDSTEKNSNQPVNDTSQVTPQLDPEIYRKLLAFTSAWKGQRVSPDSLIVGLNAEGTQPPLFWCFQGFRELSQMAKYIGADQPVYGMRSGHLLMSYTDENIQALAAHYLQEILRVQPTGSYRLGGNCQAGKIIFTVAQLLQQQGNPVALLCLLEAFIAKPYFSPVAFFFGQESDRFNPYRTFSEPELGYRKYYRGGFSITLISGGHGQYFNEPNIQVFAREVRQALDKTNVSEQAILTSSAYQAHISSVSSLTFVPGETYSLTVTVKNMSPVTWLATEQSGIFLANHWVDEKGDVIRWMDGRAAIDRNLAPSESLQLEITVTAPTELGQYQLELDLVEEGITWFKNKGSESRVVQVEVTNLNKIQNSCNDINSQNENLYRIQLPPEILELGPCIMGGTGGSGTRAIAQLVGRGGMFIGSHLNSSEDALDLNSQPWFKRVMPYWQTPLPLNEYNQAAHYLQLALEKHLGDFDVNQYQRWGWKIPPSIFFLPFLHQCFPKIKCLHLVRDGRDMAFSGNQNQLRYLGPVVLTAEEQSWSQPFRSIALWSRLNLFTASYGAQNMAADQYLQIRFEDLCAQPIDTTVKIFQFFRLAGDPESIARQIIAPPSSVGRWRNQESETIAALHRIAEEALQKFGYLQQDENLNQNVSVNYSQAANLSIVEDVQSLQMGDSRFMKGDFAGAIAHYEKAIQLAPDFAQAYEQLGTIQKQQGDLEGAIANYQDALQLDPGLTWIYPMLGEMYAEREQLESAIDAYQTAIERLGDKPDLYLHLGNLLMKQGDLDAAIAHFQQALSLNIEGGTIYICLGIALSQKGQLEDAVVAYRQALVFSPNNAYAYTMLGHTQKKQEAFEDAIKSYQQAIQYTSQPHSGTYKNLGDCCRQLGKTAEAIAAYEQSCLLKSDNAGLYRLLGDLQFQVGSVEKTIVSYQKAIELEPNQPLVVYKRLGDLLYDTGEIEAAILAYQETLKLHPQNQGIRRKLNSLIK